MAALSVILYHVWWYGGPGGRAFGLGPFDRVISDTEVGVTFFFVLSGFLLYRPYARSFVDGRPWPRLRNFAIARFLRIIPVYWAAVLVVAALTARPLYSQPWRLLANLFFVEFAVPRFLPPDMATANGSIAIIPSWSLVAEVGFYLALPITVALAAGVFAGRLRPAAVAFVPPALLGVVGACALAFEHQLSETYVRSWETGFPAHAAQFGAGMAGAAIWVLRERGEAGRPRLVPAALLAALALDLAALRLFRHGVFRNEDYQSVLAISFALFLVVVVLSPGGRLQRLLGTRLLVVPGLASYSLFLVHDPILRHLRTYDLAGAGPQGFLVTLLLVGAATAVLATTSYRLLEKPLLALKQRLTAAAPAATPAPAPVPDRVEEAAGGRPVLRLAAVLGTIIADVEPGRAREFAVEAAPDLLADADALAPIVAPLLVNAVMYGDPPFVVRAEPDRRGVRLEIGDGGRGIDPAFAPWLFEPGRRSETSRRLPGAGMGLALARSRARQFGGDIAYVPTDRGAWFSITLPENVVAPRPRPPSRGTGPVGERRGAPAPTVAA